LVSQAVPFFKIPHKSNSHFDKFALLYKNANMRTSIDFPDPLFRSLKASAAMQGTSLRDHVLQLIERGMQQPEPNQAKREPKPIPAIPTVPAHFQINLPPELMTNAGINEFLAREEYEKYLNVMKYGRGSGPLPADSTDSLPEK
jgi:hypothetical protein